MSTITLSGLLKGDSWVLVGQVNIIHILFIFIPMLLLCRLPSTSLNASVYLEDFDKLLEWDKHDLLNNSR